MSDQYLGEIRLFAGNFAPQGWALCNGQVLEIAQSTALFSLLGTHYGGNGVTTFALPDFQDRVPVQQGQGAGLSSHAVVEAGSQLVGGGQSHDNVQPFLGLNFIIALQGIFPSRS